MTNDFNIITYEFEHGVTIIPLADIHLGADECKISYLKKVVDYIYKHKNIYITLGGDLIDNAALVGKNLGVYDSDRTPLQAIKDFVEIFRCIKDRILSIQPGNHEDRSEKVTSINPAYLIASELGIQDRYRDSISVIKVCVGGSDLGKNRKQTYTILVHHGKGTANSDLNKVIQYSGKWDGVDIFCVGHSHSGKFHQENKWSANKQANKVAEHEITYMVSSSFLGASKYSLKGMYGPASCNIINYRLITGKNKKVFVVSDIEFNK